MSFSDLAGHPTAVAWLQRCLENGRLAHACLFVGPAGSGKQLAARTLAKALNCQNHQADCCGAGSPKKLPANERTSTKPTSPSRRATEPCESCHRIEEGSHPDVLWVRPESKSRRILIEQIRDFERAVNLKPAMARVKVGVVVDADCMGEEASNAFLKTLEEPPAQTIILLLTTSPEQLLPTILSRCLRLNFGSGNLSAESPFRARLLPLLASFSTERVSPVVRSYRLLAAITGLLRETRAAITDQVTAVANLDRYEELEPKVRERLEKEIEARIEGEYRGARARLLEELQTWWADLLLCTVGVEDRMLAHHDQAAELRRAAAGLSFADAARNLDAIEQIRDHLGRNISEPLAFEVGLLKLRLTGDPP